MRTRFGLRGQLVAALTLAFALAFGLLAFVGLRLARESRKSARVADAAATANALDAAMGQSASRASFLAYADSVIDRGGIRGIEADAAGETTWSRGVTHLGTRVESDGGRVRLWVRAAESDGAFIGRLFTLYMSVTIAAILLVAFVALTRLIVRPVEALTLAAERIGRGRLDVSVPSQGPREVAQLADQFNGMAAQLRGERAALETRLAELEAANRSLREAEASVERSAHLASVGRLAAGVAHEIGNPLTAIGGLVELARDDDLSADERDEFLRRAEAETGRIQRIIRDLLDFSRRGDEEEADAIAVGDAVSAAVRLIAPQRDASRVRIEQRVDRDCRAHASLDRLTQVVLNLLLNAMDAMDGEGEILVEVQGDQDHVRLEVSDTGPGIDENLLETLFEPFVTSKDVGQGTGLGLAVCHTIVERMGGTIEAQ
ncbi:MAG: HAMP domain-containing sensor histidine kinase, partial [Myxococcota bacterium]